MDAQVKWQSLLAVKTYIEKKFGDGVLPKIIQKMPADHAQTLLKTIVPGSWQPEKAFVSLLEAIELLYGDKSYKVSKDIGLSSARENISRFYKIFIHFGDPAFVISRAGRVWGQIHNTGEMTGEKLSNNSAAARVRGYALPSKAFCSYLAGYMTGILEMSGANNISVQETKCVLGGGDCCEFTATWE